MPDLWRDRDPHSGERGHDTWGRGTGGGGFFYFIHYCYTFILTHFTPKFNHILEATKSMVQEDQRDKFMSRDLSLAEAFIGVLNVQNRRTLSLQHEQCVKFILF